DHGTEDKRINQNGNGYRLKSYTSPKPLDAAPKAGRLDRSSGYLPVGENNLKSGPHGYRPLYGASGPPARNPVFEVRPRGFFTANVGFSSPWQESTILL